MSVNKKPLTGKKGALKSMSSTFSHQLQAIQDADPCSFIHVSIPISHITERLTLEKEGER